MTQADYFIPAATGGWNKRDPLVSMPETDAHDILNVFPDTDSCRIKGGYAEIADVGADTVNTLIVLADTTSEKLMCIAGGAAIGVGGAVFDITGGGAGTNINPVTGGTDYADTYAITAETPWQWTTFKNILVCVNGTDQPFTWTGSGAIAAATWTGTTLANLINVSSYKSRMFFVQKNSTVAWYSTNVDQIPTGAVALSSFDFGYIFTKGGTLVFTGSTTKQTGYIDQELFVAVSSEGEVVVYQGTYPGDASWSIVGRFFIATPLAYRTGFYVGSDLHLITWQGIVPMSSLLSNQDVTNEYITVSGKVARAFTEAAVQTTSTTAKYWAGVDYPKGRYVLISVVYGASVYQFVMNRITKAWTRFDDLAYCWAVWNDDLYYGTTSGKVRKADLSSGTDSSTITWNISQANNLLGASRLNKKVQLAQPLLGATYTPSTIDITLSIIPDFGTAETTTLTLDCDTTEVINRQTYPATGLGKFHSVKFSGANANNTQLRIFGTWLNFEVGGFIA